MGFLSINTKINFMDSIDEKQWLIKRTEDYLKQIVEDFKNQHDEQEKYTGNKLMKL